MELSFSVGDISAAPAPKSRKRKLQLATDARTLMPDLAPRIRKGEDAFEHLYRKPRLVAPPQADFSFAAPALAGLAPELRGLFQRAAEVQQNESELLEPEPMQWEDSVGGSAMDLPPAAFSEEGDFPPADFSDVGSDMLLPPASEEPSEPSSEALSNMRSRRFLRLLGKKFEQTQDLSFESLVMGQDGLAQRSTVAGAFAELLKFKSHDIVQLQQAEPYQDIIIQPTDQFDQLYNSLA